jgi:hypothetical protein
MGATMRKRHFSWAYPGAPLHFSASTPRATGIRDGQCDPSGPEPKSRGHEVDAPSGRDSKRALDSIENLRIGAEKLVELWFRDGLD